MRKLIKIAFVAIFAAVAGYGVYANQKPETMSDLMLANVEALGMGENDGTIDPNKAYGYRLTNCLDKYGSVKGAKCSDVADRESSCSYSSTWGKCD